MGALEITLIGYLQSSTGVRTGEHLLLQGQEDLRLVVSMPAVGKPPPSLVSDGLPRPSSPPATASSLQRQPFGSRRPRKVELRGLSPFSQKAGIPPACLNVWVSEKPVVRTWWRTGIRAQAVAKFRCVWKGMWGASWSKPRLRPSHLSPPSCPQISPSRNNTSNVAGRSLTAHGHHAASQAPASPSPPRTQRRLECQVTVLSFQN